MKRTPLKRKTSIARRNVKRAKARRERDFGELAEYVRPLPCLVCGKLGPSDPAHVVSRGAGGHAWVDVLPEGNPHEAYRVGNLVPLCREHHQEQHRIGIRSFEERHGVDLAASAEELGKRFRSQGGKAPGD